MIKHSLDGSKLLGVVLIVGGILFAAIIGFKGCQPGPLPTPTVDPTTTQQPGPTATLASPNPTSPAATLTRAAPTATQAPTHTATLPAPTPTEEPARVAVVYTGYQPGWLFLRQGPSPLAWAFDWLPEGLPVKVVECYYTPYPWALVYRLGPSGWPAFWPEGPGYVYAPYLSPDPCPEK